MRAEKIRATLIIEVAGRPPEHLVESMRSHIENLNRKKGIFLINQKISDAKKIEPSEEELYTCFAEVEIELNNLSNLIEVILDFMPSSVEITSPLNVELNCQEATMFANDLAGRLHRYDEIAKIAQLKIKDLVQKLHQLELAKQKSSQQNFLHNPISPVKVTIGSPADKKEKKQAKSSKKSRKKSK